MIRLSISWLKCERNKTRWSSLRRLCWLLLSHSTKNSRCLICHSKGKKINTHELLLMRNKSYKKYFSSIHHLSCLGSVNLRESAKSNLLDLIPKSVAILYSLKGIRKMGKKAFKSTAYYSAYKGIVCVLL